MKLGALRRSSGIGDAMLNPKTRRVAMTLYPVQFLFVSHTLRRSLVLLELHA